MVKDNCKISSHSPSNIDHHFFKVYLPALSSQRLNIPTTFIKRFEGLIPQKNILKGPFGGFWHVELGKIEEGFFFHNGWKAFVEDHSLKFGEFLVFRYEGNSTFDVTIFDNSGCEKEEALSSRRNINNNKITAFIKEEENQEEERVTFSMPVCGFKCKYSEKTLDKINKSTCFANVSVGIQSKRAAEVKVEKDEVFKAHDQTCPQFTIFYNPAKRYYLHIPKSLMTQNNLKIKPEMVLRDPKGRLWPVRFCFRTDGRVEITRGWRDFCKANELVRRDKCIFQFPSGRGRRGDVINVDIVKAN